MSARTLLLPATVLTLMACLVPAQDEGPTRIHIERDLGNRSFRIRVVNKLDIPIYYKLVGGRGREYVHQTLQSGESEPDTSSGGEKVLCVWDLDDQVVMVAVVLVDRSGKIVIRGALAAPGDDGAPGAEPRRAAMPKMDIVPDE